MLLEKRFIMCVSDKKRFTRAFWKDIIFPNLRCKHSWTFFILPIDLMIWFNTFTLIHSSYHFLMSDCMSRRSPPELFLQKGVLKICRKFTWEHPCRSMISIKLLCNFSEIILRHGCSLVNFVHIFRTPFCKSTSGELLLYVWFRIHHSFEIIQSYLSY